MRIKRIYYSSKFRRAFKKLTLELKTQASAKEKIFRENCFDPKLKTHKLSGELEDCWAFFISYSHRILFKFLEPGVAGFINVGGDEVYK